MNLFDRLHYGHQILLDSLMLHPNPTAGVIDNELIPDDTQLVQLIQPLDLRVKNLEIYVDSLELGYNLPVIRVTKYDELRALERSIRFVMFDGHCCQEISERALETRKGRGDSFDRMKPVRALDGEHLSSARIRQGEIDRNGRPLEGTGQKARRLPKTSRDGLKAPKGNIYRVTEGSPEEAVVARIENDKPSIVITVGDVTSDTIQKAGFTPDVMVADRITKRGEFDLDVDSEIQYIIYNPAAAIYPEAWSVMDTAIKDGKKSLILVEGEEDLMGFPAVMLAEEGAVMLYGQPDEGIVWVPVNDENKQLAQSYLDVMPVIG